MNISNDFRIILTDEFFRRIGSNWILDIIYLIVLTPLSFISCFLNLFSIFILSKIKIKQTKLYKLLMVYCLNSFIISFLFAFIFTGYSPRLFEYFYLFIRIYRCRIMVYVAICLYLFSNILDILIAFERLSAFVKKLTRFRHIKPYLVSLIILILCFLINISTIFSYDLLDDDIFFNSNTTTNCYITEYNKSIVGNVINMLTIFIRDILTLIVEIATNIFIIYAYKKHCVPEIQQNSIQTNINQIILNRKLQRRKRLLSMIFFLSLLSIVSHLIVATVYTFMANFLNTFYRSLYFNLLCFCFFSVIIKHFLNFFIFFKFNSNFRNKCKICLRLTK